MRNLPRKLLKEVVYPAGFMVLGKILGLVLITNWNNYPLRVSNNLETYFSIQFTYATNEQVYIATTFSNGVMLFFILLGLLFYLVKALYFHESHNSPKVVVRLAELNLMSLVSDSFSIYVPLFSWIVYYWLAIGLVTLDTYLNKSSAILLIIGVCLGIVSTGIAFFDVQREFNIKNNLYNHKYE